VYHIASASSYAWTGYQTAAVGKNAVWQEQLVNGQTTEQVVSDLSARAIAAEHTFYAGILFGLGVGLAGAAIRKPCTSTDAAAITHTRS
jgi:hypothetical protein